ncbi:hypothetical protein FIBSPDRAFT_884829 [Athelia psychrophila]|uniref:Uncharacterized protein n=1 Tax=Athelia psychrophila TaxID=1759441 RepID=A0A166SFJ3_9AGAM|nr:hypothetical protein FIBSPDRAFT_884829 [Fibularhizoctonia sp. CBS 109695]
MDSSLASIIYELVANQSSKYIFVAQFVVMAPITNCALLFGISATFACLAAFCTAFLFLIRVRAIYLKSRHITVAFGALFIFTIALNLTQYADMHTNYILGTDLCGSNLNDKLYGLPSIANATYDTLVFLAISYRLAADGATEDSWRARFQSIVKTRGLHSVSSSLMRSGQIYYLLMAVHGCSATIVGFSANFIVMYSSAVPFDYRFTLIEMVAAFANIMACRVFRGVALGTMASQNTPSGLSTTMIIAALELGRLGFKCNISLAMSRAEEGRGVSPLRQIMCVVGGDEDRKGAVVLAPS